MMARLASAAPTRQNCGIKLGKSFADIYIGITGGDINFLQTMRNNSMHPGVYCCVRQLWPPDCAADQRCSGGSWMKSMALDMPVQQGMAVPAHDA